MLGKWDGLGGSADSIQPAAEEEEEGEEGGETMPSAPGRSASAQRPRHSTEEKRGQKTRRAGVSDGDLSPHLSQSVTDASSFCLSLARLRGLR